MIMKKQIFGLTLSLALMSLATTLTAQTVVTFDGTTTSWTTWTGPDTESGFTIASDSYVNKQFRAGLWDYNGTAFADIADPSGGFFGVTNASGGAFSFISAAFGSPNTVSETVTVQGFLNGSQVASQVYTIGAGTGGTATWIDVSLPSSFDDVNYVKMTVSNNGYEIGFDNLTFDAPVPEPTTLALAGLGGLSLLLFRHRR
jgi:hypothetical protein